MLENFRANVLKVPTSWNLSTYARYANVLLTGEVTEKTWCNGHRNFFLKGWTRGYPHILFLDVEEASLFKVAEHSFQVPVPNSP